MICANCKNVADCINPPTNPFHCVKFVKVEKDIENKVQNNEEWFCNLSTIEKAKWICDHITCSDCRMHSKCYGEDMGRELWAKWLKAEHPKGVYSDSHYWSTQSKKL